ncbi:MAG: DUF4340 domain-containing protein [Aquisalimonadaceae bacterium]
MRGRWLLNLVLLLLVAALAAVAWYAQREPSGAALLELDPDRIDTLVVQRRNQEDLHLRREAGNWWITTPERLPASEFHVRQILEAAIAQSSVSYPMEDLEPERLGLDPPRARLQLNEQVLLYGGTEPIDGLRYIQTGNRIHLVRDTIGPLLEGPWWNFIDRRLVPPGMALVGVKTPAYVLAREDGIWRVESDGTGVDDAERLAANWQAAGALVVKQVRRQPGADAPVSLHFADGSVRRLVPANESGERRLVDAERGLAYVFDPASKAYLMNGRLTDTGADSEAP